MHWLSAEVLNAASGGKLFEHLDSVIQRQSDRSMYKDVILGMTMDDFRQFYACFGLSLTQVTKGVGNGLDGNYIMAIGQRLIRTMHPPTAWTALERDLYRWLGHHFLFYGRF